MQPAAHYLEDDTAEPLSQMTNPLDKIIGWISPERAVLRAQSRNVLAYYEAGRKTVQQRQRRSSGGPNREVTRSAVFLKEQARYFDENLDIIRGSLNTLTQNVVGANGISIEPQPRKANGEIDDTVAEAISEALDEWMEHPEVTGEHDWSSCCRLLCRSWLRDGEVFSHRIRGNVKGLKHFTQVPFSVELIDTDQVPLNLGLASKKNVQQGIESNSWGRPVAYHLLPGNYQETLSSTTQRISSGVIDHLKMVDRIGQRRGISLFASILLRMDDIKDYEDSERIAAKIGAAMAGYIRKGSPDMYAPTVDEDGELEARGMQFRSGMIFDDLRVGEEIGTIDTSRPNAQLESFRNGQLRAAASPIYQTYSSFSKNYDGTYSSQRQELIEGYGAYAILASVMIAKIYKPTYKDWLSMAVLSGRITLPAGMSLLQASKALYTPPQMPWIDPVKESKSWETLQKNLFASEIEIIRKRGVSPRDIINQKKRWAKMKGNIDDNKSTE